MESAIIDKLVRPNILALQPYRCARDDYSEGILLDANENCYGSALTDDMIESLGQLGMTAKLNRYPDPKQLKLRQRIAQVRQVSVEQVMLGVGSDEVIDLLLRVVGIPGHDAILICPPTYGMYTVCAQVNELKVLKVPLILPAPSGEDGGSMAEVFQPDLPAIKSMLLENPQVKVVFLCSPGNPTGVAIKKQVVQELLLWESYQGLVVVDEAYVDFLIPESNKASFVKDSGNHERLVVLQTLSKSFGLAAIRLGICIAHPRLIHWLDCIKAPYNVSAVTAHIAMNALSEQGLEQMRGWAEMVQNARMELHHRLTTELEQLAPVVPKGGDANFILVRVVDAQGEPSSELAHELYRRLAEEAKIVVRFRGNEIGMKGCLRITVGTERENSQLFKCITDYLSISRRLVIN